MTQGRYAENAESSDASGTGVGPSGDWLFVSVNQVAYDSDNSLRALKVNRLNATTPRSVRRLLIATLRTELLALAHCVTFSVGCAQLPSEASTPGPSKLSEFEAATLNLKPSDSVAASACVQMGGGRVVNGGGVIAEY